MGIDIGTISGKPYQVDVRTRIRTLPLPLFMSFR